MNSKIVKLAVLGAGGRGFHGYSKYVYENPQKAKIVAVAEPRDFQRTQFANRFGLSHDKVFKDWRQLLDKPKLADAIIISTPDRLHTEPTVIGASKGYDILLEKPIAPLLSECIEVCKAVKTYGVNLIVCHVLRYAPFYQKLKQILDSGQIGDICTIHYMEGVAWWHYAHSYVRGIWSNKDESSFILLAKSCHDIDIIKWFVNKPCKRVSSFGSLKHFRPENKPSDTAQRCINCRLSEEGCPYSAKKFYFDRLNKNNSWPIPKVINEFTTDALIEALKNGPYGRCVFMCGNDVADHQVVSMEFEDDVIANFTMTTFAPHGRKIQIMGTKGFITGDEKVISILDFNSEKWSELNVYEGATDITGGHGGGDWKLMEKFISTISNNAVVSEQEIDSVMESYIIVFAAEKARLENRVVEISEMS